MSVLTFFAVMPIWVLVLMGSVYMTNFILAGLVKAVDRLTDLLQAARRFWQHLHNNPRV